MAIIDSNDEQSSETDLIIYYKAILPSIFYNKKSKKGHFPLECCGFALEVKTKSNSTEIKSTVEKFKKLKSMQIMQPFSDTTPAFEIKPIRIYLALNTDLRKESEFERYKKHDPKYKEDPIIQVLCIVGKGIWIANKNDNGDNEYNSKLYENKISWRFYPNQGKNEELLLLFKTIINQILSLSTLGYLDMGKYIWDTLELLKLEIKGYESFIETDL